MKELIRRIWRIKFILFSLFILASIKSNVSFAGANSFQISPAPVPYPYYEAGKTDAKFTGLYLGMSGGGLDASGAGFNAAGRKVLDQGALAGKGAVDGGFGLFVLGGDLKTGANTGDLFVMAMNPQVNFEYQFKKEEKYSLIGFAGFTLPFFMSQFDFSSTTVTIDTSAIGIMYGIPFGVQAGFYPHKDWTLAPFVMINWILGGTVSTTTNTTVKAGAFSSFSSTDTSDSIDGYMSPSFGMDIIWNPYNVSLGTLLQQAKGGGSAGDIKTTVIQLSWQKTY